MVKVGDWVKTKNMSKTYYGQIMRVRDDVLFISWTNDWVDSWTRAHRVVILTKKQAMAEML